jgi:Tol biopolymer transport system component
LAGVTERISVAPDGGEVTGASYGFAISADGRYVAFTSSSDELVPGVSSSFRQVFVRDRLLGVTGLVSGSPSGEPANASSSLGAVISADGRHVAFFSPATNLVPGAPGTEQIYVRDLDAGVTVCASRSTAGAFGNGISEYPTLSADGRYVAFESEASNLVPGDTNLGFFGVTGSDVFVRDLQLLTTVRASVNSSGLEGNADSHGASISDDGRVVAFYSYAYNLAPFDAFGNDVFVRDLDAGTTVRISKNLAGWVGNKDSYWPTISADGRWVAFESLATDLVPDDTNSNRDVFLHDRITGLTIRVSVTDAGQQVQEVTNLNGLSGDGRRVVLSSSAGDYVVGPLTDTSHNFLRDHGPWTNEGFALAGVAGLPSLAGTGTLEPGSPGSLALSDAAPTSAALLFVSLGSTPAPFKGGTLLALPPLLVLPLSTTPTGGFHLAFTWPAGVPGETVLWFQVAIQDAAAVSGVSLSNAVKVVTP